MHHHFQVYHLVHPHAPAEPVGPSMRWLPIILPSYSCTRVGNGIKGVIAKVRRSSVDGCAAIATKPFSRDM